MKAKFYLHIAIVLQAHSVQAHHQFAQDAVVLHYLHYLRDKV